MHTANRLDESSDWELVQRVVEGQTDARQALIDRLTDPIRNTVELMIQDFDEVDELTKLVLHEVLVSVRYYSRDMALERWVHRITVHTAVRQIRRRRESLDRPVPLRISMARNNR